MPVGGAAAAAQGEPAMDMRLLRWPRQHHTAKTQQQWQQLPDPPRLQQISPAVAVYILYGGLKRDRAGSDGSPAGGDDAPRKRRSRWSDAAPITGVTTAIPGVVNVADLDRYAPPVRLDEISRKLQTGDVVPPHRERSPFPPPIYDDQGRRTNSREVRSRKKLEDERVQIVDKQVKLNPNYRPGGGY
ncbi:hypothetical protein BDZ90DRAFT_276396 [Jaminaea rosea]|uniref:Splicing factor 1 helix-hairpin domain-containing protein n=1 Tax=Jaminaea rosea TaxID=1569628 RepID=A0A316UMF4_9BASI|nr:hypothetical protein BDZ90DRAFT_276396 [Jaminaea rosea]PWN24355.1 hypothetical protein BDZ90DRAFT_276396 [Jaminaea rosea]